MDTREFVDLYLQGCRQRGLSPRTTEVYERVLRHFIDAFPELPTSAHKVEAFFHERGETAKKRGKRFQVVQGFYTWLERDGHIKTSPVPPKGKLGRPHKPADTRVTIGDLGKLHLGGPLSDSKSTSISTQAAVKAFTDSRKGLVSARTEETHRSRYGQFIRACPTLPLTPEPIEAFLASLKVDRDTQEAMYVSLRALYRFLEQRYSLTDNPMRLVLPRRRGRKVRPTLDITLWQKLLALDMPLREKALFQLLADAPLRAGEILSLTPERLYPGHIRVVGKTGEYSAPISSETYDLLRQLAQGDAPLFRNYLGGRLSRQSLYRTVRAYLEQIGYKGRKKGPHMLRHSYGRHYMAEGGDLMSLKEIMGHTQVQTTARYAQLDFTDVQKRHREIGILHRLTNEGANNVSKEKTD